MDLLGVSESRKPTELSAIYTWNDSIARATCQCYECLFCSWGFILQFGTIVL